MISLDTNIIFCALNPRDSNHQRALNALDAYSDQPLGICPVVYAELQASSAWAGLEAWLRLQSVEFVWDMPQAVWDDAGNAFGAYSSLRRGGVLPRRIVGDFLIAAHAEYHALEVLTLGDTAYRAVFGDVKLLAA
jgi:predicted nucleic acid-binding protein